MNIAPNIGENLIRLTIPPHTEADLPTKFQEGYLEKADVLPLEPAAVFFSVEQVLNATNYWLFYALDGGLIRCKNDLAGFHALEDGWYNGDGAAPFSVPIAMANFLLDQYPSLASVSAMVPAIDGGVLFEFRARGWDYALEINNMGTIDFQGIEIDGAGEYGPDIFEGHRAIEGVLHVLKEVGCGREGA